MKLALCLSGGGFRGVAHIGVLKFLEEQNVHIEALSGSSAGAIVALMIADGKSSEEIFEIVKQIQKRDVFKFSKKPGFFSLDNFEEFLRDKIEARSFEDLKTPFFVCATDLKSGKAIYLDEGDPISCTIASSSLSPIFEAKQIKDIMYIDGGFTDNLPVAPLQKRGYKVLSISVNPIYDEPINSTKDLLLKSLFIMLNSNMQPSASKSDAFLEIKGTGSMNIFDFDSIDKAYEYGYEEAKKNLHTII